MIINPVINVSQPNWGLSYLIVENGPSKRLGGRIFVVRVMVRFVWRHRRLSLNACYRPRPHLNANVHPVPNTLSLNKFWIIKPRKGVQYDSWVARNLKHYRFEYSFSIWNLSCEYLKNQAQILNWREILDSVVLEKVALPINHGV